MRRLMQSLPFLLLMATAVLFTTSCGKDGDAGPAGEKGEKGDKGDKGDPGDPGTGSATVIYSDWLDVTYEADTIHLVDGTVDTIGFYAAIAAPKLTNDILHKGELKVYINLLNVDEPVITPLPYTDLQTGIYISYVAIANTIDLYSNIDARTFQLNDGSKVQQYRYILIPGTDVARKASGVDWNNYAEVKKYLNLKD